MTKSLIFEFQRFIVHFFLLTKVSRYSLVYLCQNMLVADCTFFHLALYFISYWLKFPGVKYGNIEPSGEW